MLSHARFRTLVLGLGAMLFVALGVAPNDRVDWAAESALLVAGVAVLIATRRLLPLSRTSYALIFLFCCLHMVGAHYRYSEVPYRIWMGLSTDGRNHYDRFVHFSYGLLLGYPIREIFLRVADVRGFWGYYLPLDVTMATSMLYELIEWAVAELYHGDLAIAYLGAQGDIWDAQKDMSLAMLGAVLAMTLTALINVRYQRDFAREWAESLRVKKKLPLGEDALRRLWRRKR